MDPNDLLIFKLRGMTSPSPQPRQRPTSAAIKQSQQPVQKPIQVQPQLQPQQPQVTAQAETKHALGISIGAMPSKKAKKEENLERAMEPNPDEELVEKISREVQQARGEQLNQPSPAYGTQSAKMTKSKKEAIDAAQGYVCVNHPWRPAYAICDYCKRPFCYADLVEFNDRFYCLEDIDKVSAKGAVPQPMVGRLWQLPGIVFLANAALMAFFIYPQTGFFISHIARVGLFSFLFSMTYAYGIATLNFLIAIVSLAMGIILLLRPSHVYIGGIVGMVVLVGASYEYLNSAVSYLLLISILSFIATSLLLYNRMSSITSSSIEEVKPTDIEWPRLETF